MVDDVPGDDVVLAGVGDRQLRHRGLDGFDGEAVLRGGFVELGQGAGAGINAERAIAHGGQGQGMAADAAAEIQGGRRRGLVLGVAGRVVAGGGVVRRGGGDDLRLRHQIIGAACLSAPDFVPLNEQVPSYTSSMKKTHEICLY